MKALASLANRLKSITVNELLLVLSQNKEFTDLIIELNTRKQLYDKGIDSLGENIGTYSAKTKQIKAEKGQIIDHVTLFDTGDFYKSFRIFFNGTDFIISADTIKDTDDLIYKYGEEILGLTQESLSLIREKAKEIIIPYVRKKLLTR